MGKRRAARNLRDGGIVCENDGITQLNQTYLAVKAVNVCYPVDEAKSGDSAGDGDWAVQANAGEGVGSKSCLDDHMETPDGYRFKRGFLCRWLHDREAARDPEPAACNILLEGLGPEAFDVEAGTDFDYEFRGLEPIQVRKLGGGFSRPALKHGLVPKRFRCLLQPLAACHLRRRFTSVLLGMAPGFFLLSASQGSFVLALGGFLALAFPFGGAFASASRRRWSASPSAT